MLDPWVIKLNMEIELALNFWERSSSNQQKYKTSFQVLDLHACTLQVGTKLYLQLFFIWNDFRSCEDDTPAFVCQGSFVFSLSLREFVDNLLSIFWRQNEAGEIGWNFPNPVTKSKSSTQQIKFEIITQIIVIVMWDGKCCLCFLFFFFCTQMAQKWPLKCYSKSIAEH